MLAVPWCQCMAHMSVHWSCHPVKQLVLFAGQRSGQEAILLLLHYVVNVCDHCLYIHDSGLHQIRTRR